MLLLRAAIGITAVLQGGASVTYRLNPSIWMWVIGLLMIAAGIAMICGFLTPVSAAVIILGNVVIAILRLVGSSSEFSKGDLAAFYVTIMAIATVFLGPGAFSLDARMFGRREIVIPPSSHSEKL